MVPAARAHGLPGAVAAIAQEVVLAALPQLIPNSPEHKLARWQEYQAVGKKWDYNRWSKQYDINMRNGTNGIAREAEYQVAMNAVSKTLKTPLTLRQIDLFKRDERYCGQLKTGKMSLTKQAKLYDIPKDAELVKQLFAVEYILEKGASKPFLAALDAAGVTYKIGPQIP